MGKKSKKKGGAANKAARKERLLERREQQLEQLDQYSDDGGSNEIVDNRRDREYFVGDRVWFIGDVSYCRGNNPNTYRGIVHAVDEDFLEIKPLQALIDGVHYTQRIPRRTTPPDKCVFPDFCDLTLQFDLSDKVICNSGYWEPASVLYLWPIDQIEEQGYPLPSNAADKVPRYKCKKEIFTDGYPLEVPEDDDDYIRVRPTSFRFKVGDEVTFNSSKARGMGTRRDTAFISNYLQGNTGWTDGKIIMADVYKTDLDYAVYQCSFKVGTKTYSCFIDDDDDENIALIDENPRKRLFDAIEQDCSRDHFIYLASHFGVDVTVFRDLVLMKAIEFASYDALAWLQHDCGIDARTVKDKDGNNFLHMIANSPFAYRFIRRLGRKVWRRSDVKLDLTTFGNATFKAQNNSGDVWLQCLVHRGNIKALDVVFSPHCGLACASYFFRDELLKRLAVTVGGSDDPMIQHIFDAFVSFHTIYRQWETLSECAYDRKSEEELLQGEIFAVLQGDDAKLRAKLMTRFYRDYEDILTKEILLFSFSNIFCSIVRTGRFQLFQLLYEADQSLFENAEYHGSSKEDDQEFIQEELRTSTHEHSNPRELKVDIFYACILGSNHARFRANSSFYSYVWAVENYFLRYTVARGGDFPTLHQYLSRRKNEEDSYLKYKLRLLGDESDVEGRQQILHYLLLQNKDVHLSILVPLIHRQCWALRFLVNEKYLDLDGLAAEENSIVKSASTLSFLNSGKIPTKMTIRCCLSFAAVQYDDLQSLEWLCESFGPPNDLVGGWNILHYSAFMGRIEIIGWLSTQPNWDLLVSRASSRKKFDGAFAVHIAASCGHLHACDLLMKLKVPLEDAKGKLPDDYAKKSQHEFVREWASERAKPLALQKDVKKLLRLVEEQKSAKQIKDFILSSRCLDIETWRSCGCETLENKLGDISFRDVIAFCCKHSDVEMAKWICLRLCFRSDADAYSYMEKAFWGMDFYAKDDTKLLHRDDLILFVRERGYDDLEGYLLGKWFKDMVCSTTTGDHILEAVFSGDNRIDDVKAVILRITALIKVAETSSKAIVRILESGGRVDELKELLRINTASTADLWDEAGDIFDEDEKKSSGGNEYGPARFPRLFWPKQPKRTQTTLTMAADAVIDPVTITIIHDTQSPPLYCSYTCFRSDVGVGFLR